MVKIRQLGSVLRAFFSKGYWVNGFSLQKAMFSVLTSFGSLWLLVEIAAFFSEKAALLTRGLWWLFLLLGVVWAVYKNWPNHTVSCRLAGRDISLNIRVADVFDLDGVIVVSSNTSFDTDSKIIRAESVQGQFASKFYDSVTHLNADIDDGLAGHEFTVAGDAKKGKKNIYPVGTTVQLEAQGRKAYFLALASMSDQGVATAKLEDVRNALPALWDFVANHGAIDLILMPVIGSGFSRVPESREDIVREIIKSFVAGCSARRFTESLTIVLHPRDFYKHAVDIDELRRYLLHVCKYTEFGTNLRVGGGTPAA